MNIFAEYKEKAHSSEAEFSHGEAFERNIGLVTGGELAKLRKSHVAFAGLGGVGCAHLEVLLRQGIGGFSVADPDHFEMANFNRQWGAALPTIGRSKTEVAVERIKAINPEARIHSFPKGITLENLDAFLSGVSVVVDGLDYFAIEMRRALYRRAYEKGIPVVTSGPMGYSATLHTFVPGGMTFDQYFDLDDTLPYAEKMLRFTVGLTPRGLHCAYTDMTTVRIKEKRGPSSSVAVSMCAAFVGMEVIRLILGWTGVKAAPHYRQYDLKRGKLAEGYIRNGNRGLWQRFKLWVARRQMSGLMRDLDDMSALTELTPMQKSITRMVEAALSAPSGDNCQPFKFKWNGEVLSLRLDHSLSRHALDRGDHVSFITLGGVLEAIRLAAGQESLVAHISLVSDPKIGPAADIRFTSGPRVVEDLLPAVSLRHTDRRPYHGGSLNAPVFSALQSEQADYEKVNLSFTDHWTAGLLDYISRSEAFNWSHRPVQKDLMRWMRFTRRSAEKTRDGLPRTTLGISILEQGIVALCRFWPIQQLINPVAFIPISKIKTSGMIRSSAALGLITVRSKDPQALIEAGRIFFRTWCLLNLNGYGLCPLTSAAISVYDRETAGLGKIPSEYEALFESGASILQENFHFSDGEIPLLMFRTGRSRPLPSSARTLRRSVKDVLILS